MNVGVSILPAVPVAGVICLVPKAFIFADIDGNNNSNQEFSTQG